jgi:hypothetical protein
MSTGLLCAGMMSIALTQRLLKTDQVRPLLDTPF